MKSRLVAEVVVVALVAAFAVFVLWTPERPSVLPEFDAAKFTSHGPSGRSQVWLRGSEVQKLRAIFEGVPREREPKKWVAFGQMTLFERDKEVLEIQILSGPQGEGPFGIKGGHDYLGYDEAAFKALLKDFGGRPDPAR